MDADALRVLAAKLIAPRQKDGDEEDRMAQRRVLKSDLVAQQEKRKEDLRREQHQQQQQRFAKMPPHQRQQQEYLEWRAKQQQQLWKQAGGDENAVMRVFQNLRATDEQKRAFVSALVTFAHAYVLCPSTWQIVNLSTVCARDPGGPRYALCPLPPDAYLRKRCGEKPSASLSASGPRLSGEYYDTTAVAMI